MNSETRSCQNCKQQFVIDAADFDFYAKMSVPPPTFCPQCRLQRRMMVRNERVFYRRECGLCGQSVITIFAPDKAYTVYCQPCWWSDKWDPFQYFLDYDPSRPFFEQLLELQAKTPYPALVTAYSTLVNSDYVNHAGNLKNSYLIFNADFCENTMYSSVADYIKDSADCLMIESSELCYEDINCEKCFKTFYSEDCVSCTDVYFSKNMSGCGNCFGCTNLRGKNYHIWNEPYTKEAYEAKIKELRLDTFEGMQAARQEAIEFWKKFPHKSTQGTHNVNVSGDYAWESKNSRDLYYARYVEDSRFCSFITLKTTKDCYDYTEWGAGAQNVYECLAVGEGANNVKFSYLVWGNARNCDYSAFVVSSSNMFGCVNIRKGQHCILNKRYSEEEYNALRTKIIEDMNAKPYIDAKGRVWKYGEFLPYDLCLFDYNESYAVQYFPMNREEALAAGFRWRDAERTVHEVTMPTESIPASIHDAQDDILKENLGCGGCGHAFRMVPAELYLLRRFDLPLPRKCFDCRHMDRIARSNPPYLFARNCAKCGKDIQTSFAPARPEIVYCENCYQNEVV